MRRAFQLALMLIVAFGTSCEAETIKVCADATEMPPFSYKERINGMATDHVIGVTVDMIKEIGRNQGFDVSVELLPWLRCLSSVRHGQIQVALNVGKAEADGLTLSKSYFTMHSVYFYSSLHYPHGLQFDQIADLRKYRICGLLGKRFELFGIDTSLVDTNARTYEQMLAKMKLGRCDLFIDTRETLAGMYLLNPELGQKMVSDMSLVSKPLTRAALTDLYFGVSPAASGSLVARLNAGLDRLRASKEVERLIEHYLTEK